MKALKRIRTRILKVTQEEFAKAIGRRQSVVSRWETRPDDPRLSTVARILEAYPSLDPAEFFKRDNDDEEVVLEQGVGARKAADPDRDSESSGAAAE